MTQFYRRDRYQIKRKQKNKIVGYEALFTPAGDSELNTSTSLGFFKFLEEAKTFVFKHKIKRFRGEI